MLNLTLQKIENVRKSIMRLFFLYGISWVFIVIAVFMISTFIIDWFLRDIPALVRVSFLLIGIGFVIVVTMRKLIKPFSTRIKEEEIAHIVEKNNPELRDLLISAVEFNRNLNAYPQFNSPELAAVVIKEAEQKVVKFDFSNIINTQHTFRYLGLSSLLWIIILVYSFVYPDHFSTWLNRIFGGSMLWPRETDLFVLLDSKNIKVGSGEDFLFFIGVNRKIPSRAYVDLDFYQTGESKVERFQRIDSSDPEFLRLKHKTEYDAYFKIRLTSLTTPLKFKVRTGDATSDVYSIEIVPTPEIQKIKIFYTYPEYSRLQNTPSHSPDENPNLSAIIGTNVSIEAYSNIELKSARIIFYEGKEVKKVQPQLVGPKKQVTKYDFTILKDAQYEFELISTDNIRNRKTYKYTITAIIDNSPRITILYPTIDKKYVTPDAILPISVLLKDDYGLSSLKMEYKIKTSDKETQNFVNIELPEDKKTEKEFTVDFPNEGFSMSERNVQPGDIIDFLFIVQDNRTPQPNETKSPLYRLIVITREQMMVRLDEIQMRLKEDIRSLYKAQQVNKSDLEKMKSEFIYNKEKLSEIDKERVSSVVLKQKKISSSLQRVHKEMKELALDLKVNKISDANIDRKMNDMLALLADMANIKSPQCAESIASIVSANSLSNRQNNYDNTSNFIDALLSDFENLLNKMEEWENYREIIRLTIELKRRQEEIRKKIENLGEKK